MPSYLVQPVSIFRNYDVILAVTVMSNDAIYYVTRDNRRQYARRCEQLYVIVRLALRTIVRNNDKGHSIVYRKGNVVVKDKLMVVISSF